MKTPIPRSVRVIVTLLCGVAMLLLAASARAQTLQLRVPFTNSAAGDPSTTSAASDTSGGGINITVNMLSNNVARDFHGPVGTGITNLNANARALDLTTNTTITQGANNAVTSGTGDIVDLLGSTTLTNLGEQNNGNITNFTATVWFKMAANSTWTSGGSFVRPWVLNAGAAGGDEPGANTIGTQFEGVGNPGVFAIGIAGTSYNFALPGTANFPIGKWLFFAVTYDNSTYKVYYGTDTSSVQLLTGPSQTNTPNQHVTLGASASLCFGNRVALNRGLNGYMEDFRFYSGAGDANFVESVRALQAPIPFYIAQQPQNAYIPSGGNATFTVSAGGDPAATSYQWYQIGGGATNSITGATTSSLTITSPTASGTNYFVVVGNGITNITSSLAQLNFTVNGIWNTSNGSWSTAGNWVGNAIADGGGMAWFTNGLGGTITLDNTPGFAVGTNIFGVTGAMTVQPAWTINSGSPAGTLTLADGGTGVPQIIVYSNNPVTINAPLAGTQGLSVTGDGGGTLVLASGNTNNTYSGPTTIGVNAGSIDMTALQIGNGGTSGAIDFASTIYLEALSQLIFDRSDTITVSSIINNNGAKAPNMIVNSGTVIRNPSAVVSCYMGAIVNSGGILVLNCPAGVYAIANTAGTINPTNGMPNTPTTAANGGNAGGVSLNINSGGVVQLAGPGGNGVNIQANNGVLDNGVFDLGGDNVQLGFIFGAGIVTNSGATLATLNLQGGNANTYPGFPYVWSGTIAGGATAQTAVTLSGGTTIFTGPNTYTGNTFLSGGSLMLSNSASLASSNIIVSGGNLILVNTPTVTNPHATISVGSGRTMDISAMTGNFSLGAGQTLVVTNTGTVNAALNILIAASGSTLVPGGNGTAGTMNVNGNLTLNGNTNLFDLATAATEGGGVNDEIVGVTNLTLSSNITIKVNTGFNSTFSPATSYKLIKYSGTLANTATFTVVPSTLSGNTVTIDTVSQPGYVLLTTSGSSPPSLTVTATNINAFTGYPFTLSATEAGSTPLTNQWYNGASAIPGATSTSYTFTPATPGAYIYTLWATNAFGRTNVSVTVNVGSPTISIQCTLDQPTHTYALYLAPTDTAGAYAVSNWNVFPIIPNVSRVSTTFYGIGLTNPVDSSGFATPVIFTAVGVNDGYHELQTITSNDTPNARMMNTYWYANPLSTTPPTNVMALTFTNLPNDTYDIYVYLLQQVSSGHQGQVEVYDGDYTNYLTYGDSFTSTSNFVTGVNTIGTGVFPFANYAKLRISTGGSNSISFNESGTVNGAGGAGVTGIQIVPVPPSAISIVQQPVSQRVVINLTATFSVQANGFPLNYHWYSVSRAGATNLIASATNASYTTAPVMDSDTGTGFFVVISNSINQVQSSTAYLTVGRMVTAPGLLIEDQFYYTEGYPYILIDMYPHSPVNPTNLTLTAYLNTFESVGDLPVEPPPYHPSAERIYGLFTPAVSGDYVFFITSDDAGALWLSTNSNPANSYLIAQNQGWMSDRDWTCANTASSEYVNYFSTGEFRSDLFISGAINNNEAPFNQYSTGWSASPNYNGSDGGIALVAGTPYYIELDNYYAGSDSQSAAVTYKLAGNPDPNTGDVPLLTSNNNNISASVPDSVLPVPQPTITNTTVSGSNVILTGTNGLLNAVYYVLSTTNLTTPPTNWTVGPLNVFDVNGNFINTNPAGAKETFYRLQVPAP